MNQTDIQLPPHNSEAEDTVIASCLLPGDTSVYDSIATIVRSEDFYTLRGRILFDALAKLASQNKPLDEIGIQEVLKGTGGLDEVGGIAGLMSVADKASTEPQAIHYAKLIVEKSNLRSVIRNCRIAVENAESEAVEYEDIRAELEGSILEIDSKGSKETTISDSIDEIFGRHPQDPSR